MKSEITIWTYLKDILFFLRIGEFKEAFFIFKSYFIGEK